MMQPFERLRPRGMNQQALLQQLGGGDEPLGPEAQPGGMSALGGALAGVGPAKTAAPSLAAPVDTPASPMGDFAQGAGSMASRLAQEQTGSAVKPFQSQNASVSGFLQEAIGSQLGDLRKIGDDAGRKKFAEDYIRTLVPEIEKRGGKVGDIRNEKIQIDGQWRDLIRDIDGTADAQYIVPDEGGQTGGAMSMLMPQTGAAVDPLLGGDPLQAIQAAIGQYANQRPNMQALLQQLGV